MPKDQIPQRTFPVNCRRDVIGLNFRSLTILAGFGSDLFGNSVVQVVAQVRTWKCLVPSACLKKALAGALCICFTGLALAKDDDDDGATGASKTPNIYLDMRTAYASVPAGALPIGFGNSALVTALQSFALSRANSLPAPRWQGSIRAPSAMSAATTNGRIIGSSLAA